MPPDPIIRTADLTKTFGATTVLQGVDLEVARGSIFALLGPNGAGKTTMVNILTTLKRADAGTATVAGHDVSTEAARVRSAISVTGQYAAVDDFLTGAENLRMMARLAHQPPAAARARADELLAQFDLTEAAHRKVATYSGGMRRRLDLAISLVGRVPVIFLDEPTTGLDPRSRLALWQAVRDQAGLGTTIFLTTQYLEEADQLADRIAVIDGGRIIAEGRADDLKRGVSGDRVEIGVPPETLALAAEALAQGGVEVVTDVDRATVSVAARDPEATVPLVRELLARMDEHRLPVGSINVVRPSLDDVFLALTGHAATQEVAA